MRRSPLHLAALLAALFAVSRAQGPGLVLAAPQPRAAQKHSSAVKPKATPTPKPSKARAKTSPRKVMARPTATPPPAKPDRSLYEAAEKGSQALRDSSRRQARPSEWDRVVSAYRLVVHKYPRSPYCDDALLKAGDLLREMASRFKSRHYSDQALESYALIVSEYPRSRQGEAALFATYEILLERNRRFEAGKAAEKYLAAYPDGKRAKTLGLSLASSKNGQTTRSTDRAGTGPEKRGGAPSGKPGGAVQVFGVRFWSGESSTRVVIDLDRKVEIRQDRLQSPPRLFVDLIGTRLHPNLIGKTFPVGNAFLKQIRIGLNRENVVRVVIDFAEASGHGLFFLDNPERLVIDIKGAAPKGVRVAGADPRPEASPTPGERRNNTAPPQEVMESVEVTQPAPVLPETTPESDPLPESQPTPLPAPIMAPTPPPPIVATPSKTETSTGAPIRNRDGTYSLARQLGLGARRICLDAGHGGHDPGAIGRGGAQEKDITLAVVLKLEKLIRTELGADVVLTRDTDVFIPLEERTAIANASGADLFLSVHINSARNRTGRGIETYYLSFAKSAAAEELAARENAISQATMKDLNNLVKAIATNSKIDESRDFAGIIQRSNIQGLSSEFQGVLDRGVHTAPFYVLIGANMPSILTEVGFISNAEEERWLKSDDYQEKLAESLLEGVRSYLGQLNRNQATRLGGRNGVRVGGKGRSQR